MTVIRESEYLEHRRVNTVSVNDGARSTTKRTGSKTVDKGTVTKEPSQAEYDSEAKRQFNSDSSLATLIFKLTYQGDKYSVHYLWNASKGAPAFDHIDRTRSKTTSSSLKKTSDPDYKQTTGAKSDDIKVVNYGTMARGTSQSTMEDWATKEAKKYSGVTTLLVNCVFEGKDTTIRFKIKNGKAEYDGSSTYETTSHSGIDLDDEDSLEHYGRLGMKWYQHKFGEVDGSAKYAQKGRDMAGKKTAKLTKTKARSDMLAKKGAVYKNKADALEVRGRSERKVNKYRSKGVKMQTKSYRLEKKYQKGVKKVNKILKKADIYSQKAIEAGKQLVDEELKKSA